MLQQILRDMWVDPEILAELDETQKQTLFCKMREEQVRRWQAWDQKVSKEETDRPKFQSNAKKQVSFLKGEDGEPWVWVMGEHPEDQSIESILAEEARQRALAQAREEAHQLRKSVEKELTHLIDYKPLDSLEQKFDLSPKTVESLEDTLDLYCSVDELRERIAALEPQLRDKSDSEGDKDYCEGIKLNPKKNTLQFNFIEGKRDVIQSLEDTLDLYCSVDELRERIAALEPQLRDKSDSEGDKDYCEGIKLNPKKNTLQFNFIEGKRDVIQDSGLPRNGDGVSLRVAAWERRVAAARAGDILRGLRARRARTLRDAQQQAQDEDDAWREQVKLGDILRGLRARRARTLRDAQQQAQDEDDAWREQERKAKEAEAAMREIARAAREAHRRSVDFTPPCHVTAGKPPNREAVLEWFRSQELKRAVGLDENNKPVNWFHGLITRSEAEQILSQQAEGSFLVRLSERIWGYAISYRAARCKHYLVDASDGYRLLGAGQIAHDTLADLINYHKKVPITESGGELLTTPCVPAQTPLM